MPGNLLMLPYQFFVPIQISLVLVLIFILLMCSLDYPGVGPEHSFLKDIGRAEYYSVTDEEALEGMTTLGFICFV